MEEVNLKEKMKSFKMIYFIPIKENSQRVPMKNFRDFSGEPLFKHTLLKLSKKIVYVDTDSDIVYNQIKSDNRLSNVNVYYRDKKLIGDKTSVCDLIKNFIDNYNVNSYICQIHVTSPLLNIGSTEDAFKKMTQENYDSCFSANKINSRLWRRESYGLCPINHNPMKLEQTQDLPSLYEENSLFYIFHSNFFAISNNRIGKNPFIYETSFPENIDIDTEDDWNKAKYFENIKKNKGDSYVN